MATLSAREMIRLEYGKAKNFMTPHVIRVGKIRPHRAFELSWGYGFDPDRTIYGVSIVDLEPDGQTKRRNVLAKCFENRNGADLYIECLRRASDLLDDALQSCASRGHRMVYNTHFSFDFGATWTFECSLCQKSVTVTLEPPPNGIDIGGEAVALGCED